jgi:hypothetical protein
VGVGVTQMVATYLRSALASLLHRPHQPALTQRRAARHHFAWVHTMTCISKARSQSAQTAACTHAPHNSPSRRLAPCGASVRSALLTRSHTSGNAPPRGQLRQRSGRGVTSSSCALLDDASTVAAAAQARPHRLGRAGACQSRTALRQHAGSYCPRRRGCCSRRRPRASRGRRCGGVSSGCLRPGRRSGDAGTIGSSAQRGAAAVRRSPRADARRTCGTRACAFAPA